RRFRFLSRFPRQIGRRAGYSLSARCNGCTGQVALSTRTTRSGSDSSNVTNKWEYPKMMRYLAVLSLCCAGLISMALPTRVSAGTIVGAGHTPIVNNDNAGDIVAIDLTNPASLSVGTYNVSSFNYEFLTAYGA